MLPKWWGKSRTNHHPNNPDVDAADESDDDVDIPLPIYPVRRQSLRLAKAKGIATPPSAPNAIVNVTPTPDVNHHHDYDYDPHLRDTISLVLGHR